MPFLCVFTILTIVASLSPCALSAPSAIITPISVTTSSSDVNTQRRSLIGLSSNSQSDANAYINTFNDCNSASGGLGSLIDGVAGTVGGLLDTAGGLLGSVLNDLEPTLTQVADILDHALPNLEKKVQCTEVAVAATVYGAFSAWASLQLKIFAAIAVHASQLSQSTQALILATLAHLQATIDTLLAALFNFISKDLDILHLSVSLRLGVQAATKACS